MSSRVCVRGALRAIAAGWLACAFFVVVLPAGAQDGPPSAFAERIEVRVLNLEAVVTDRDGERMPGLEAGDFRLLIDGEEVPIEFFTEVRGGTVQPSDSSVPDLEGGAASGTSVLLFIDEVFAIKADKTRTLRALAERVGNLGPKDQVAVVAWDGSNFDILSDWTGSVPEVQAAVAAAIDRPSNGLQRRSEQRQFNVSMQPGDMAMASARRQRDPFALGTQERMYAGLLVQQIQGTVTAASAAMRGLQVPSGRKVLAVLSGGWPMEVTDWVGRSMTGGIQDFNVPNGAQLYGPLADVANLLGYTIYAIDMPGLQSGRGGGASQALPTSARASSLEFFMEGGDA